MSAYIIWHNPRCSKSRETLQILRSHGIEPEIVDYLNAPLSLDELQEVIDKLGVEPESLVRKHEELYRKEFDHNTKSGMDWLTLLLEHPKLIERPIVIKNKRAIVGRPPENVLSLILSEE